MALDEIAFISFIHIYIYFYTYLEKSRRIAIPTVAGRSRSGRDGEALTCTIDLTDTVVKLNRIVDLAQERLKFGEAAFGLAQVVDSFGGACHRVRPNAVHIACRDRRRE